MGASTSSSVTRRSEAFAVTILAGVALDVAAKDPIFVGNKLCQVSCTALRTCSIRGCDGIQSLFQCFTHVPICIFNRRDSPTKPGVFILEFVHLNVKFSDCCVSKPNCVFHLNHIIFVSKKIGPSNTPVEVDSVDLEPLEKS